MALYLMQLFISEGSPRSVAAEANLRAICRDYLEDGCQLEIVDIRKEPEKMIDAGIIALPTLVRNFPLPVIRIIGALSVRSRVLAGLGITDNLNDPDERA